MIRKCVYRQQESAFMLTINALSYIAMMRFLVFGDALPYPT